MKSVWSSKMKLKNKYSISRFFIPGTILILFALSLPTFGFWSAYSRLTKASSLPPIQQYQHPLVPVIITKKSPEISAANYILVDDSTNTILLSHNIHDRIYPASITKLATALTALNIYPLDELITAQVYDNGQNMKLAAGETITVKSLVDALLVFSANDAAFNLANHHPDGITGFVKQMNLIAGKYNLKETNFTNFDGIHDPNHYSSVYDLSQLGRLSIKNSIIREAAKNKKITVTDITGKISHTLESTDELIGIVPEIEGLKTGWTPEAGGCFLSLINLNGHLLIGVVAQSTDRFADTVKILNWAKDNVVYQPYTP